MFKHKKVDIERPFAKAEFTEDGHYYRTNEGKLYPSITTVFKALENKDDWYPYWVSSIAKKEGITEEQAEIRCKEISQESLDVGNELHASAENYVNGKPVEMMVNRKDVDSNELFTKLAEHLDEHIGTVYGVEKKVYSDEMQIAGTSDLVAEYDGELSIIDFKNSRKKKTKSECKKKKYFEQICAYAKMWEYCTGQKIKQGVILVVSWDGKVQPFKVNIDDHEEDLWSYLIEYEQKKALNTT